MCFVLLLLSFSTVALVVGSSRKCATLTSIAGSALQVDVTHVKLF